jgi:UDP-N-acetylmuramoyl-tripeptide--D-alanyl-D-alanine ligase
MPSLTIEDVVRGTQGTLVSGDLAVAVTGLSIDTRTLRVGEAFFAICGHQLDGHAFLDEAAARGAACLVVHTVPDDLQASVPVVLVDETTHALGRLAAYHRARFAVPVVAVTGSNGKTTTKEMTASVLGAFGPVLKPEASFNNQWGLPLTLLKLDPRHAAVVLELGANQPGEIAALARICRPAIGVVTQVASAHTESFGSLEGVATEKSALVRAIPPNGAVILNAGDPRVLAMRELTQARVLTFGLARAADVHAVGKITESAEALDFGLAVGGHTRAVRLAFAGRHNVVNALAAAAVGHALGLEPDAIAAGLEAARPLKGRCVWRRAGQVAVLDDTYNANPASLRTALETFAVGAGARRRVVVLGDMLELGAGTEAAHRDAGRAIAKSGAAELLGVGRHALAAVEAARAAGLAESHHAMTFEDTVAVLLKRLVPGDALLVKGSRGMRMERVVDALVARLGGEDG